MADDAPCGSDLEYDPVFLDMQSAAAGKPEQQYGDKLIPAEGPEWRVVHDSALALAGRTRDLRVAVWLLRGRARLQGLAAALEVLPLIHGLLLRHWDHLHPQLDASDNNDPTMRLNALAPLTSADAALADLRAARLGEARGSASVRDIELALDRALPLPVPLPGESAPTEAGAREALAAALVATPELGPALQAAAAAADGLSDLLVERIGKVQAPDLKDLCRLLHCLADAASPAAR
ncbi:MAG: type VI secretion system ImpA family N-terminal domain-containing protein, partial [Burkholderiales bacterium]|nr:type VI secretion system ImpA family N-terminal domain-containing protein [Burkholderiales bacterium]